MLAADALVSALGYLALALALGHLVTTGFLLPPAATNELRAVLLCGVKIALLVFLFCAICGLVLQGTKLQRGFPSVELLWRYLTVAQSGQILFGRVLYAALLTATVWQVARNCRRNSIRCLALLTIPLIASRSLTSHAAAVRGAAWFAIGADALHSIAAMLWSGGVIAMWRVLSSATDDLEPSTTAVARFSRLALISVALLMLTGLYQAWLHVGSVPALAVTDYGKTLVVKLILFAIMLSVGAINFFSTRKLLSGKVRTNPGTGVIRTAKRRVGVESGAALLVFCATGLLVALPPGIHAVHQNTSAIGPLPATERIAKKTYLPAGGASVNIIEPKPGQVFVADQVPLRFILSGGQRAHHVHAYVDGELVGMFQSESGTLNGLKPGRHLLELRAVAEDHQSELDAFDRVEFVVK